MLENQILKDGIKELYDRGKISSDTKTDLESYLDNLSEYSVKELGYSDFNVAGSTGITANASARTITTAVGVASSLITSIISLSNVRIKSLKLKGTEENINWFISTNGSTWYSIDSYNADELMTTNFYLKVASSLDNVIKGLVIIYHNN